MRRAIILLVLISIVATGYYVYQDKFQGKQANLSTPRLTISQGSYNFDSLTKVLGTATNAVVDTTTSILNHATDGEAEPLINKTLENLQNEVKDLPREQYEKVKYEFCRDVVSEYETDTSNE